MKKTASENEENRVTPFDYSYGVVHFYFPELDYKSGLTRQLKMSEIHLYEKPESTPSDSLQFTLKPFSVKQSQYGDKFYFSGKCYEVSTTNGTLLNPYCLKHGISSAKEAATNEIIKRSNDPWVHIHLKPTPIYRLRFRTYGDWENNWLRIVLDENSGKKLYIRRDNRRMCFLSWDGILRESNRVRFQGHTIYDLPFRLHPNGIPLDDEIGIIRKILGDWVQVYIYKPKQNLEGWIQWKDNNGILQGIFPFTAIY